VRHPFAVVTAVLTMFLAVSISTMGVATADTVPPPPYVAHAEWAHWGDLSSLRVYPTPAGRKAAGQLGTLAQGDEAWGEVLALSPDADMPGMRAQFMCHWRFAEFAEPGKTSWNLEPWRPVVDDTAMADAHCNPGGTEEPF
jgi:Protein of unknown function (DUF2599)